MINTLQNSWIFDKVIFKESSLIFNQVTEFSIYKINFQPKKKSHSAKQNTRSLSEILFSIKKNDKEFC